MSATNWGQETDFLSISKRAKGRDRYNARRNARAGWRRYEASKLLEEVGYPLRRGWQSDLARRLGVNRSTICRDFVPYKKIGPWCLAIVHCKKGGQWRLADLFRAEMAFEILKIEDTRRLGWRLDRRQRLGLRW